MKKIKKKEQKQIQSEKSYTEFFIIEDFLTISIGIVEILEDSKLCIGYKIKMLEIIDPDSNIMELPTCPYCNEFVDEIMNETFDGYWCNNCKEEIQENDVKWNPIDCNPELII